MKHSLKKYFYTLTKSEFDAKIAELKKKAIFLVCLDKQEYFLYQDDELEKNLIQLHKLQWKFDQTFNNLSSFVKSQMLQLYFIDEVKSTNEIENIKSTRHDIFYLINKIDERNNNVKLKSITHSYQLLLTNYKDIKTIQDIRSIYDILMKKSLAKQDIPDGTIFRKGSVSITDGMQVIHKGLYPESTIIEGMKTFIDVSGDISKDIYIRHLVAHFILETVHPFYDGNGRLGRYLLSLNILKETNSYLTFFLSTGINKYKSQYYAALNESRKHYEGGCLNGYIETMINIISSEIKYQIKKIEQYMNNAEKLFFDLLDDNFTKAEMKILKLMCDAKYTTLYGVTNDEIAVITGVTKRTVINSLNKFRNLGLISDKKIGRYTYHMLISQ